MLFKIHKGDVAEVLSTKAGDEGLYERDVEDWVVQRPEILGEDLLVIGRQVQLDEGRDWIDVLALDRAGSLVVVELKRDLVGGQADLQGLRYAALVSRWSYEGIQRQAEGYWKTASPKRGTFAQEVDAFADEGYELNTQQRVILAGRDVKPRLGTMALWLRDQGLDVRVVSIELFREGDLVYLQPQVVIPPPTEERFKATATVGASDRPWLRDGEAWHLQQRASARGRQIIEALVAMFGEAVPEADGPNWGQKFYISWKYAGHIWATISTGSPHVERVHLKGLEVNAEEAAQRLGWEVFDGDAELSEKFGLGSNVGSHKDGGLRLTVKSSSDLVGDTRAALIQLTRDSWKAFTGQEPSAVSGSADESEPGGEG